MKHLVKKILTLCIAATTIVACDVIDNPIKEGGQPSSPDSTTVVRKVVIEDFTGHQCKNCPDAAKKIKELQAAYGTDVVAVAVHAGPSNFTGTNADYPTDFTTAQGTDIFSFFNIPALPMGMVSRDNYTGTGNGHLKTYQSWPAAAASLLDSVARFTVVPTASYNQSSRQVSVEVTGEALANYASDLMVVVMVLESHIISPQLMPDNTRNPDYEHNHVLRTSLTPTFGNLIKASPIIAGDTYSAQFTGTLDASWNDKNCEILAYVYNADNYEILQAEVIELK